MHAEKTNTEIYSEGTPRQRSPTYYASQKQKWKIAGLYTIPTQQDSDESGDTESGSIENHNM